jgi:hypothetical protein
VTRPPRTLEAQAEARRRLLERIAGVDEDELEALG